MPTSLMTYTRTATNKPWIQEHYANDPATMDLINHYMNYLQSKTHCQLRIEESDTVIQFYFTYPDEHEVFDDEIAADPKLLQFTNLLQQYYSQDGYSMSLSVEE